MSGRPASLRKLERLYGLVEHMHAAALQRAAALVQEAETAMAAQRAAIVEARVDAHAALAGGDRERYAVAEVQRVTGGERHGRLETLRETRATAAELARAVYEKARIERGQIKTVVDRAASAERVIEARRAQAASDDRFLSRQRWNRLRDGTA